MNVISLSAYRSFKCNPTSVTASETPAAHDRHLSQAKSKKPQDLTATQSMPLELDDLFEQHMMIERLRSQLYKKDGVTFYDVTDTFGIFHILVNLSALSEKLNEPIIALFHQYGGLVASDTYEIPLGEAHPNIAYMVEKFERWQKAQLVSPETWPSRPLPQVTRFRPQLVAT